MLRLRTRALTAEIVACSVLASFGLSAKSPILERPEVDTRIEKGGATVSHWEGRGVGAGGALMDPSVGPAGQLFVATDMTSLFRSGDFGRSWSTIHFRELQASRGTRVTYTSDPLRLYTIDQTNDEMVPAVSTDGGATWGRVSVAAWPRDVAAYSIFSDDTRTQLLLVATYEGIRSSTDGGQNFQMAYEQDNLHVAGVLFDGNTIYAGTSDGVLRSVDGGRTFAPAGVPGLPDGLGLFSFAGAREGGVVRFVASTILAEDLYAGMEVEDAFGEFRGLYAFDLGGDDWQLADGVAEGDQPVLVGMARNDVDSVIAAGSLPVDEDKPQVYRSSDGGRTFSPTLHIESNQNIVTGWGGHGGDRGFDFGGGHIGLSVAPYDAKSVVVTDYGYVHVSEDGGLNWRQAYVHPDYEHPAESPTPQGAPYRDAGLENTSVWSLAWADQDTLFAGFSDIRGIRSTDGGTTWAFDYSGHTQNSMYRVVRHPSGTLYAATSTVHDLYQSRYLSDDRIDGGSGRVLRSSDGGGTWELVHDFGHVVAWIELDPTDPDVAYASVAHSTEGGIFVTRNLNQGDGETWERLPAPPRTEGHPYVLVALDDGGLVASYSGRRIDDDELPPFTASSGVFFKASIDAEWVDRSSEQMHYWTKDIVVDPHDPEQHTWYAAVFSNWGGPGSESGGLYRTRDRGQSWSRILHLDRVESIGVHPQDPDFAFVTSETQGLWFTIDLQSEVPSFESDEGYPFRQPLRAFFNPFDTQEVWVSSFGGGLRVGRFFGDAIFASGFDLPP